MRLNPKFILRRVADETLLISVQDITSPKRLLVLNELGTDIYALLQEGADTEDIFTALLSEYDVKPDVLKHDIDEFLQALTSYGVIID